MDQSHQQLWELAHAAQQHAWDQHGAELSPDDWPAIDRILACYRRDAAQPHADGNDDQIEALAAYYGAWIGCRAVATLDARWIGLHEAAAPRILVGGVTCSPIDAVRRILLLRPDAIGASQIARQMQTWKVESDRGRKRYLETNESAWDELQDDERFTMPSALPLNREQALLAIDPWLRMEGIADRDVLCLAAGGGLHGPLYALAGARVTVVDLSDRQLKNDRRIAEQLDISLRLIRCSIDNLCGIDNDCYDFVVQPVSSCYLPDLQPLYREVARVLRPGGVYISQHKQPTSLQSTAGTIVSGDATGYAISLPQIEGARLRSAEPTSANSLREPGTAEFLHSLHAIIGGLCQSGFVIEDFMEPPRADAFATFGLPEHRARFLPPYLKIKARRRNRGE
jgi:SAM-dependent methyltransferase